MPNRVIRDSILTSRQVGQLDWFQQALLVRLILSCDDYGRYFAAPDIIRNRFFCIYPGVTQDQVTEGMERLEELGFIITYRVEGELYCAFPQWSKYQVCRTRREIYPAPPPEAPGQELKNFAPEFHEAKRNSIETAPETKSAPNPIQSESESNPKEGVRAARFTPPTVDEVRDYCRERGNAVDAERFVDFYAAKGWMVGKNRMKDWKAAVRTWEKEDGDGKRRSQPRGVDREEAQRSDSKWGITYST